MVRERIIRLVAGTFVMTGLVLGLTVSPWWFGLCAFVGLNLFQSSLTRWCLLDDILRKTGVPSEADLVRREQAGGDATKKS
jgi:hypothetical protein